jgi:alpha-N-arabinofuranosidase
MEKAARHMDGLSLHYYTTVSDNWNEKGSATEFSKEIYDATVVRAGFIDTLCRNHGAIMDLYDPDQRVGLIVDEWGTWYDVEPGTNPGFIYMQDTMRDAIVAALTLNVFNKHCKRVHMANIAQLINVLQAVILTEGAEMVMTPTFHVFEMFKDHQGAELVASDVECPDMTYGKLSTPMVSQSASIDENGNVMEASLLSLKGAYQKASAKEFIKILLNTEAVKRRLIDMFE